MPKPPVFNPQSGPSLFQNSENKPNLFLTGGNMFGNQGGNMFSNSSSNQGNMFSNPTNPSNIFSKDVNPQTFGGFTGISPLAKPEDNERE